MHSYASLFKITVFVSAIETTKIRRKTHQYAYREFLWFSSTSFERRKMWNAQSINQSINQSIKWSLLLLLLFPCHDYNNDKDDIPATIIYNMRQSLLKIILHDKLSSSYCACLFMPLCVCMWSRRTHIWLELNTKANKNEKEERDGNKAKGKSDFHFSVPKKENGWWRWRPGKHQRTLSATKSRREWEQKEESIYIYIYNII